MSSDRLPVIPLGKIGTRGRILVAFPGMYSPRAEDKVTSAQRTIFYDKILIPAYCDAYPERGNTVGWDHAQISSTYTNKNGSRSAHAVELAPARLHNLVKAMRRHAARHAEQGFVGFKFLTEFRGFKARYTHDSHDSRAVEQAIWSTLPLIQQCITPSEWWVDVGLQVSSTGYSVHWKAEAVIQQVMYTCQITRERAARIVFGNASRNHDSTQMELDDPKHHKDFRHDHVAHLGQLAGVRTVTATIRKHGIFYLQLYETGKTLHNSLSPTSRERRRSPKELLDAKSVDTLLQDMERREGLYSAMCEEYNSESRRAAEQEFRAAEQGFRAAEQEPSSEENEDQADPPVADSRFHVAGRGELRVQLNHAGNVFCGLYGGITPAQWNEIVMLIPDAEYWYVAILCLIDSFLTVNQLMMIHLGNSRLTVVGPFDSQ